MNDYPEHDKLKSVAEESQIIGEFLDTCGYVLCVEESEPFYYHHDEYIPTRNSIQQILAHYFSIDLDRIEAEKRAMLGDLNANR